MSSTPNFGGAIVPIYGQLQNSDSTNKVALTIGTTTTAAANPRKISALAAASTETANNRDISFYFTISGTDYLITTITLSANSGLIAGTPPINLLYHTQWQWYELDSAGNRFFMLPISAQLKVASGVAFASGKIGSFMGDCQEYA